MEATEGDLLCHCIFCHLHDQSLIKLVHHCPLQLSKKMVSTTKLVKKDYLTTKKSKVQGALFQK